MEITVDDTEELAAVSEFAGMRNALAIELAQAARKVAPHTVTSSQLDPEDAMRVSAALKRAKDRGILDFTRNNNMITVKWTGPK